MSSRSEFVEKTFLNAGGNPVREPSSGVKQEANSANVMQFFGGKMGMAPVKRESSTPISEPQTPAANRGFRVKNGGNGDTTGFRSVTQSSQEKKVKIESTQLDAGLPPGESVRKVLILDGESPKIIESGSLLIKTSVKPPA